MLPRHTVRRTRLLMLDCALLNDTDGVDVFERDCPHSVILFTMSKPLIVPFFASVSSPHCYLIHLELELSPLYSCFRIYNKDLHLQFPIHCPHLVAPHVPFLSMNEQPSHHKSTKVHLLVQSTAQQWTPRNVHCLSGPEHSRKRSSRCRLSLFPPETKSTRALHVLSVPSCALRLLLTKQQQQQHTHASTEIPFPNNQNIHKNNLDKSHPHTLSLPKNPALPPNNGKTPKRLHPLHATARDPRLLPQIRPLKHQTRDPRPVHHRPRVRQRESVFGVRGAGAGLSSLGRVTIWQVRVLYEQCHEVGREASPERRKRRKM